MQTLGIVQGGLGCLPPQNGAPPPLPLPLSLLLLVIVAKNTHLLHQVRSNKDEGSLDDQEFEDFRMLFHPH